VAAPLWLIRAVIRPADVKVFGQEVMQRLYIESIVHGNTSPEVRRFLLPHRSLSDPKKGAREMQDMVERVLHPRPLTEAEKTHGRSLLLPSGRCCI
jgi:insulysin